MEDGQGEYSFEISTLDYNVNPTKFTINVDNVDQLRGRKLARRGEWEVGLLDVAMSDGLDVFGMDEMGRSLARVRLTWYLHHHSAYSYYYLPIGVDDDVPLIVDLINNGLAGLVEDVSTSTSTYTGGAGQWVLEHMWRLRIDEESGKVVIIRNADRILLWKLDNAIHCGWFGEFEIAFSYDLFQYFGFRLDTLPSKVDYPVANNAKREYYFIYICDHWHTYTKDVPIVRDQMISHRFSHIRIYSNLVKDTLALCPLPVSSPFTVEWKDMEKMESVRVISISAVTPDGREPFYRGSLFLRIGIRPKAVVKAVTKAVKANWVVGVSHVPHDVFRFDLNTDDYPGIDPTSFSVDVLDVEAFRMHRVDLSTPMEVCLTAFSLPNNIASFPSDRAYIHICVRVQDSGRDVFKNYTVYLPWLYYGEAIDIVRVINQCILEWWSYMDGGSISASGENTSGEYFNKYLCSADIDPVSDFVFFSHSEDRGDSILHEFQRIAFSGVARLQEMTMWTSIELLDRLGSGWSACVFQGPNKATPPVGSEMVWQRMHWTSGSVGKTSSHAYINNPLSSIRITVDFVKFANCVAICTVDHTSNAIAYAESSDRWNDMVVNTKRFGITLLSGSGKRVVFKGGNISFSFAMRSKKKSQKKNNKQIGTDL